MKVSPDLARRLRDDDPTVRIERLEDSAPVTRAEATFSGSDMHGPAGAPVETLLNEPEHAVQARLDGFSAFLSAPPQHQLEVAFVEYLRRLPEQGARESYLPSLASGALTIMQLRDYILDSEEFRARRVGYGARLGASLTSPLWRDLEACATLLDPHVAIDTFDIGDHAGETTAMFVDTLLRRAVGREPTAQEAAMWIGHADSEGRRATSLELSRFSARRGVYFEVV